MIVGRGSGDPFLIAETFNETSDFIPDLSKLGAQNLQTRPRPYFRKITPNTAASKRRIETKVARQVRSDLLRFIFAASYTIAVIYETRWNWNS